MGNPKLEKFIEHLLNNREGQAKALLHEYFIEQGRAIHEELRMQEEDDFHDDDGFGGGGDQEKDFLNDLDSDDFGDKLDSDGEEINFEEVMSEEDDMEDDSADMDQDVDDMEDDSADMDQDVDDMEQHADDMKDHDESSELVGMEQGMDALSKALEELEAEFDELRSSVGDADQEADDMEQDADDMEQDADDMDDDAADMDDEVDGMDHDDSDSDDKESVDEEWDDLHEALQLDVVNPDILGSQKDASEIGSGKFVGVNRNPKSPSATSQKDRMGARPVQVKSNNVTGYNRETPPSSQNFKHAVDNRNKRSMDDLKQINRDEMTGSLLRKSTEGNKKSPLTNAPQK